MNIEYYLKQSAVEINRELERFFPRKINSKWLEDALGKANFAFDKETSTKAVADVIWNYLDRGGKRWRPALMLLSCEAVGGNPNEIREFVVLPELVHNGTIMVDDVEDGSELRRGKPAAHKIYGVDLAINDGNLMYYLPLILLYKNVKSLSDKKRAMIYDIYSQEMLKLSFGQASDIYWHQGKKQKIDEQEYLQMCAYKTGALARLSAKAGAVLGNGSKEQIEKLGEFAGMIGVAFQIQDDILNLIHSQDWGKETGEDIKEGKRTLLVIYTLNNTTKEKAKRLLEILGSHTDRKEEIEEAIEIIKGSGAIEYTKEKARKLVKDSWIGVDKILKKSKAKNKLKAFADYLIERKI